MRKIGLLIVLICVSLYSFADTGNISGNLSQVLANAEPEDKIRINVRLSKQYSSKKAQDIFNQHADRTKGREAVIKTLQTFAKQEQADLLAFMQSNKAEGKVSQVRSFWIINLINCYATPHIIHELSQRQDVEWIDHDKKQILIDDFSSSTIQESKPGVASIDRFVNHDHIEWNVNRVYAPEVWENGHVGDGVVVAVFDTGVNADHLDLSGRMWQHPDYPNHGYNFVLDNHDNTDHQGHGSHCAGTVASNGQAGKTTGVAPGATIMNLKVIGDDGGGTQANTWEGIQFAVSYGAHVMSLSLGWQHAWGPDRAAWRIAMDNALAAGVIASVAAGNEGASGWPPPNNIRTPSDCPAPWTHPDQPDTGGNSAVVTVGSTQENDTISAFSSIGPVTWQDVEGYNDYPYEPGEGLISPDIVAPGSNVVSLAHDDNEGYTTKSGTSMAAPNVAGVMALMISKNPRLTPEEISQILEETASDIGDQKNNTYGSGLVHAHEAIQATPYSFLKYVGHEVNTSQVKDSGTINPGDEADLSLSMTNPTNEVLSNVELKLTSTSSYITITDSVTIAGDIDPGEDITLEDAFAFEVATDVPGNHIIDFVLKGQTDSYPETTWHIRFDTSVHAPHATLYNLSINDDEYGNANGIADPGEVLFFEATIKNTGKIATDSITFHLPATDDHVVFFSEDHILLDSLEPGDSITVSLPGEVNHETNVGSTDSLTFLVESGDYLIETLKTITYGDIPVYDQGNIPSTLHADPDTSSLAEDPGHLSVSIPAEAIITGVDVQYQMVSQNDAWRSEQRSYLRCISPGGEAEPEIIPGPDINLGGSHDYHREDLEIANLVSTDEPVEFELHAFRTYGGEGSDTHHIHVANNSFKVIVDYDYPIFQTTFQVKNQFNESLENATIKTGSSHLQTNEEGEAHTDLPAGYRMFNVEADKHRPVFAETAYIQEDGVIEVILERLFEAEFIIKDKQGESVEDAIVVVEGDTLDNLVATGLENGTFEFDILAEGFETYQGTFVIDNEDITVEIQMQRVYKVVFNITDPYNNYLDDAVIAINETEYEPGEHTIKNLTPGTYAFTITAAGYFPYSDNFTVSTDDKEIDVVMEVDDTYAQSTSPKDIISVYPNPARDYILVELKHHSSITKICLFNDLGTRIKSTSISEHGIKKIDLQGLTSGVYFIIARSEKRKEERKIIVK